MKALRNAVSNMPYPLRVMTIFSLGSVFAAKVLDEKDVGAFLAGTLLFAFHSTWSIQETNLFLKSFSRKQVLFWVALFSFLNVYIGVFFLQVLIFGIFQPQTVFSIPFFYEWLFGMVVAFFIEIRLANLSPQLPKSRIRDRLLRILAIYFFVPFSFVSLVYFLLLAPSF